MLLTNLTLRLKRILNIMAKQGIKDFISRVKGEKSANKVHSKDHPDVQNLAEKIYKKDVKKMFPLGNNTKRNTKVYDKAVTKAQRMADSMQSIMSKNRSKTEGSFSTGGKVPKGYHKMPNGKLMKDSAMKKKMGGGMMQQPMGYDKGGMCRGMGAAIRGGKFEGVK